MFDRGRVVLTLSFVCAWSAATAADKPQQWALLIGVDQYAYVHKLKYCVADQEALAKQLIVSGFPADQVFVLDDQSKEERFHPFKSNIESQLELVLGMVHKGDTLVVSFSGHGISAKDGKSYLLPVDAKLNDPAGTMISLDKIYDQLSDCPAGLKLMMVDACRNDPFAEDEKRGVGLDPEKSTRGLVAALEKPPEGISLLMSCGPGQFAREDATLGHGVFVHFLLEGLSGKAADDDGVVSLMRLADYTSRSTEKYVHKTFNAPQTPFFRGEVSGTVELARIDRTRRQPESAPIKPGESITNSIGMKLTLVPAGEFMMGSSDTVKQLRDAGIFVRDGYNVSDEGPRHRVRITKPFLIGTYSVTIGQFRQFVTDASYVSEAEKDGKGGWGYNEGKKTSEGFLTPQYNWRKSGWAQTDQHPVVNVSWNDAQAFCDWLSKKTSATYRLPTEAQREYACRAGSTTRFWTGDVPGSLSGAANVRDASFRTKFPNADYNQSPAFDFDDGWPFTSPVGSFRPNKFGLYDMTGNVWEWCQDWYDKDYYAHAPIDDPTGPASGVLRVLRGGSWFGNAWFHRSAYRYWYAPDTRFYFIGFRVVCDSIGARTP